MKFSLALLVLASALAVGQSQNIFQSAAIKVVRAYCEAITLANPLLVLKVRGGDFTVDDEKVKKYSLCVYKTLGIATAEGVGDKAAALKLIFPPTDPIKFAASFDACNNQTGTTPQDKIWKFLVCYSIEYPGDIVAL